MSMENLTGRNLTILTSLVFTLRFVECSNQIKYLFMLRSDMHFIETYWSELPQTAPLLLLVIIFFIWFDSLEYVPNWRYGDSRTNYKLILIPYVKRRKLLLCAKFTLKLFFYRLTLKAVWRTPSLLSGSLLLGVPLMHIHYGTTCTWISHIYAWISLSKHGFLSHDTSQSVRTRCRTENDMRWFKVKVHDTMTNQLTVNYDTG